jgi:hypothetical protein
LNGSGGGAQFGIELTLKANTPSKVCLLYNLLYQNDAGDIANGGSALQNAGNLLTPALGSLTLANFFVNAAAGDLHHAPGSPAIDAGTSTTGTSPERVPTVDFEGDARVAPVDIGVDELADADLDLDGIPDRIDNCPPGLNSSYNPGQEDRDADGHGDMCDNCPDAVNPGQEDQNGNSRGDACEDVGETLYPCTTGDPKLCTLVANFGALQNVETIRPDCLNTTFYCTDSLGNPVPRSEQLPPPRGIPGDVTAYETGDQATVACDLDEQFPLAAFPPGTYTCKACYVNDHQDPGIDANGNCSDPEGCLDLFQGITCSAPITLTVNPTVNPTGCSPTYWRNDADQNGATNWLPTGLAPTDDFDATLGVDFFTPNLSLLDALHLAGDGKNALALQATGALLSALHPKLNYPLAPDAVRSLLQSGDPNDALQRLTYLSGLNCKLPLPPSN